MTADEELHESTEALTTQHFRVSSLEAPASAGFLSSRRGRLEPDRVFLAAIKESNVAAEVE